MVFILLLVCISMAFFLAQWEEYYTGEMLLGEFGVTEMELMICALYLILGIFGNRWLEFSILGLSISMAIKIFFIIGSSRTMIMDNIGNVKKFLSKNPEKLELAYKSLLPALSINLSFLLWGYFSPSNAVHSYRIHFFTFSIAIFNAGLTGRQVLAKVCKMGDLFQFFYFPIPIYIATVNALILRSFYLDELLVVFVAFWGLFAYLHFAISIIEEICQKIGINCFKIGHNLEYQNYLQYLKDYFAGKITE